HWVPPSGRSGGILLGVDLSVFVVESTQVGDFFVKFIVKNKCDGFRWVLMAVYGAAQPEHKDSFLAEFAISILLEVPRKKNNDIFDSRWPLLFNACIETLNLRELALSGRRFTWASSAEVPTYEKLDRILVSTDWEQKFSISTVEALTRELSDHTPLLLDTGNAAHRGNNHLFKFELGWLTRDGFHEMVAKLLSPQEVEYKNLLHSELTMLLREEELYWL
ncbi:hypothetical protein PVAP13_2NG128603, partial [Panicum virgatum]